MNVSNFIDEIKVIFSEYLYTSTHTVLYIFTLESILKQIGKRYEEFNSVSKNPSNISISRNKHTFPSIDKDEENEGRKIRKTTYPISHRQRT